ncbi:addiction module antidote protein [Bradyrhizobium sp. SZCCHNS2015]|uniref:addiction module antidote protein n=1 Tax=Bradyrhizobium sp. SZCCHNS2015 TaxID=3057305 RepID=UPI0028E64B8F|nr:addiction module antidote protein [Bradyrhizobium sp. SZCCHNS2015]
MTKIKQHDAAEYLDSPETIAAYITKALESGDPSLIAMAIGVAARAKGIGEVAEKVGLSRENLYLSLGGEAKPEFSTILKVLQAVEIGLIARPAQNQAASKGEADGLVETVDLLRPHIDSR